MNSKNDFVSKRFHVVIDAFNCPSEHLNDETFLVELEKKIAEKLEMSILKGPVAAQGIPENPGISVFSIIDFSHISIHTFTETNQFYLDIFSCKPFDYQKLIDYVQTLFRLEKENIKTTIVRYDK